MGAREQLEPAALVSEARGRIGMQELGPPTSLQIALSQAISLKRIADVLATPLPKGPNDGTG